MTLIAELLVIYLINTDILHYKIFIHHPKSWNGCPCQRYILFKYSWAGRGRVIKHVPSVNNREENQFSVDFFYFENKKLAFLTLLEILAGRECPLNGNCLTKEVIQRADVMEEDGTTNTYTGLTGSTFKERFYGHTSSFRNRDEGHSTTLSSHIWNLKDAGKKYERKWRFIDRGKKSNPTSRKCNLCLKEKYHMILQPSGTSLNKRSELFSMCRHKWQQLLENV